MRGILKWSHDATKFRLTLSWIDLDWFLESFHQDAASLILYLETNTGRSARYWAKRVDKQWLQTRPKPPPFPGKELF